MGQSTPVKTFDELFAELTDKATTRPAGSGTVAALDSGVHTPVSYTHLTLPTIYSV